MELARYFAGDNVSPFEVEDILGQSNVGIAKIVEAVNMSNDVFVMI